jgi:predicted SprT family Zn-dependent metalloprotease
MTSRGLEELNKAMRELRNAVDKLVTCKCGQVFMPKKSTFISENFCPTCQQIEKRNRKINLIIDGI